VSREGAAPTVKDGCRFHGSLTVNKVAGNFHITAGKYVWSTIVADLLNSCRELSHIVVWWHCRSCSSFCFVWIPNSKTTRHRKPIGANDPQSKTNRCTIFLF